MADRYWVGGTANWDGTAGTKWATTSGGAGGASVPTSADAVFFTAASTGTCTIASGNTGAQSIDCTGHTGTIAGGFGISVAGSVTLVAGQTFTYTGRFTLTATGTLTTAGKSIGGLTVDAPSGTVTLGSALTSTLQVTITAGTLTTSVSNYAITATALSVAASCTLTLNGSTVTLSTGSGFTTSASSIINAGTSTINLSANNVNFGGSGRTYNNVSFTGTDVFSATISGSNTFSNLTLAAPTTNGVSSYSFGGSQTITTFVAAGASAVRRIFLFSATPGTRRTLSVTTWSTISDVDFRDIGMISARSGTRLGNCGNNNNITFDAAKTVYWNLAGAQNWSATGWATTSGGTPAVNNFPLAQDTAVFDNTGSVTGTITINSGWNIGTLNMGSRTSAMTLSATSSPAIYANWTNGSGITLSGSGALRFDGTTTQTITSSGKTFPMQISSAGVNNTITLADALTTSAEFVLSEDSSVTLNNNTLTCASYQDTGNTSRTLAFGTGNITVTGTGATAVIVNTTGFSVTGTPVINLTYSGASAMTVATSSIPESSSISFNVTAGSYALTFSNAGTARNLNFTGFSGSFAGGSTMAIYGNLILSSGMTIPSGTALSLAATSGTKTITSNGRTIEPNLFTAGVGGTFQLLDALNVTGTLGFSNGTLDLNGQTATAGTVNILTGTKNLTFNGGTLVVTTSGSGAFNNTAPTGFTTTAGTGTGTIRMSSASAKTFVGGGSTYNCTLDQGGAGALTITGANTFSNITNSYGATGPTSILFTAGTTTTFTDWNASGQSGRRLTIGSVTAAGHTLSKASGIVNADFLSVSRSTATGGATWYAGANSVDGGNNSGWIFAAAPLSGGNFFAFFI